MRTAAGQQPTVAITTVRMEVDTVTAVEPSLRNRRACPALKIIIKTALRPEPPAQHRYTEVSPAMADIWTGTVTG